MDEDAWTEALVEEAEGIEPRLDEIEAEVEARARFKPEDFAIAGCVATIGRDGTLQVIQGLVKPEDMPKPAEAASAEPSRRAQELVEGAGGGEFVEPAEGSDDGLLDALAFAAVFGDLKILIRANFFDADEHVASPSLTPHIVGRLSRKFQRKTESFSKFLARIYHYILENDCSNHLLRS